MELLLILVAFRMESHDRRSRFWFGISLDIRNLMTRFSVRTNYAAGFVEGWSAIACGLVSDSMICFVLPTEVAG